MGFFDRLRETFESDKVTTDLPIEIDREALAETGWEIVSCTARLSAEPIDLVFNELEISGEFRWHPRPDRFGSDDDVRPVPVFLIRTDALSDRPMMFGPLSAYQTDTRFSHSAVIARTAEPLDPGGVIVTLTARDSFDGPFGFFSPHRKAQPLPVRSVVATADGHVGVRLDRLDAFLWDDDGRQEGVLRAGGVVEYGTPQDLYFDYTGGSSLQEFHLDLPFEVSAPYLLFDLLDGSGRLLDRVQGDIGIYLKVDEQGRGQSRNPTWDVSLEFDPGDYDRPVAQVVVLITDE